MSDLQEGETPDLPEKTSASGNKKSFKRKASKELTRILGQREFEDFVEFASNSVQSDINISSNQNLGNQSLDNVIPEQSSIDSASAIR